MNVVQNSLVVAGAVLGLGVIGSNMQTEIPKGAETQNHSPFAARAASPASLNLDTLVTVGSFNIDEPGRIPFQATVNKAGSCASNECFFEFGSVPQGRRVVIQRISGLNSFNAPPSQVLVFANNGTGQALATFLAPTANSTSAFDHQTELYYDPNQIIEIQISPFPATFLGLNAAQSVTVTGYELNCAAAPCSAIAH